MLNLDTYPKPKPGVVGRVIDNEAVIVLPEQGQVKVLNEVGARIWQLVNGTRSIREIASLICEEYEVDLAQAEADSLEFISDLVARGVVSTSKQPE